MAQKGENIKLRGVAHLHSSFKKKNHDFFHLYSIPQLSITNSTSSPSTTPSVSVAEDGIRVKAEPLSPRDLHQHQGIMSNVQQLHPLHHPAQLQRPHSANSAMSPHLSPNHLGQGRFTDN